MNCRDFERFWQEQFDAGESASPDVARALDLHAASCGACHAIALRYQNLRQAIHAWGLSPAPSADLVDRVLSAAREPAPARALRFPTPLRWAAAATVLVSGALALRVGLAPENRPESAPRPNRTVTAATAPRPLSDALAEATSATWALARETSAPAARVGREVLSAASEVPDPAAALPNPGPVVPDGTEVLQTVGNEVNRGIRPLSGSAQSAFSFLIPSGAVPASPPGSDHDA